MHSSLVEASRLVPNDSRSIYIYPFYQLSHDESNPGKFAVVLVLDEAGLPKQNRQALKRLHEPLEQRKVPIPFLFLFFLTTPV